VRQVRLLRLAEGEAAMHRMVDRALQVRGAPGVSSDARCLVVTRRGTMLYIPGAPYPLAPARLTLVVVR